MSRSTRAPYFTEGYGGKARKTRKRLANKRVRAKASDDSLMAEKRATKAYRKLYNSWDICDWKFLDKTGKARRK